MSQKPDIQQDRDHVLYELHSSEREDSSKFVEQNTAIIRFGVIDMQGFDHAIDLQRSSVFYSLLIRKILISSKNIKPDIPLF